MEYYCTTRNVKVNSFKGNWKGFYELMQSKENRENNLYNEDMIIEKNSFELFQNSDQFNDKSQVQRIKIKHTTHLLPEI